MYVVPKIVLLPPLYMKPGLMANSANLGRDGDALKYLKLIFFLN